MLTGRLATEVSSLETVTGAQLGTVMESVCLIVASIVIAFTSSWQLTLVNLCFLPIVVVSSSLQVIIGQFTFSLYLIFEKLDWERQEHLSPVRLEYTWNRISGILN